MSENLDNRDINDLYRAFEQADYILAKKYQQNLSNSPVCDLPEALMDIGKTDECFQLFHIERIVYNANENNVDKLTTVFHSVLPYSHTAIIALLIGSEKHADLYMGIVYRDTLDTTERSKRYKTLADTLQSNFPGVEIEAIPVNGKAEKTGKKLLTSLFDGAHAVSAVSGIAAQRRESSLKNEEFIQGMERLIDAMRGKKYAAMWLADGVSTDVIEDICADYEDIYSQLSPFLQSQQLIGKSKGITDTNSIIKGVTDSTNESVSHSVSHGATKGEFRSDTFGGGVSIGISTGVSAGVFADYHHTRGKNESTTDTTGDTKTTGTAKSLTEQNSVAKALSNTETESLQITFQNRAVKTLTDRIDEQIKRLRTCEDFGMFECGAYFIAEDVPTAVEAAATYQALMRGENSSVEASAVNTWFGDAAQSVFAFLKRLQHPQFAIRDFSKKPIKEKTEDGGEIELAAWLPIAPTSLVSGRELAIHLGLPRHSIPGLPVLTCAEFGREASRSAENDDASAFALGSIYHMHKIEQKEVELSVNSLASHTFITGSTGSGKSNTVYHLLDELDKLDVRFMVVEPAKGEYKDVFGGRENVSVYSTNARKAPLLRLNPFSFPDDIHVLEHIDRLVEIFNACWPMYAAMPAVLKDAVEQAYRNKGWDLTVSQSAADAFPTFDDLLRELPLVMEQSAYSPDTKGDYIGALVTRVKSLTNGINGQIFCASDEMTNDMLFDQNVIVDISRVGSMETKSLLMGILVMKLQEYRMTSGRVNSPLQHVTVLEEAHNLLRRTSDMQTQESSNLQGKSVEMITNAIAEMRTYGEGFIIADQAPGLMDPAVIRNTNTKIIMRLPDESDRQLVGKAASLNDAQITELSKLPLGVAAVYQNDWLESVLCKIERFSNIKPFYYEHREEDNTYLARFFRKLFGVSDNIELSEEEIEKIRLWIARQKYSYKAKYRLWEYVNGTELQEPERKELAVHLFDGNRLLHVLDRSLDTKIAIEQMDKQIAHIYGVNDQILAEYIRQIMLQYAIERKPEVYQERLSKYIAGRIS